MREREKHYRSHRSTGAMSVAGVIVAVALFAVGGPRIAHAEGWVVRPVALSAGAQPPNVDVSIIPGALGDSVSVAYTLPLGTAMAPAPGDTFISTLAGRFFDHRQAPGAAYSVSAQADAFGQPHFATRDALPGSVGIGTDLPAAGGMLLEAHPALLSNTDAITLAIDRAGIPTIVGYQDNGHRVVSRFDAPTAAWVNRIIGYPPLPPGPPAGGLPAPSLPTDPSTLNHQSLVYDTDNRAALAFVPVGSVDGLELWRDGPFGWALAAVEPDADPGAGTSVAANSDGGVGFAYATPMGLMFRELGDLPSQSESVAGAITRLTPRSLAYDPDGRPALVYNDGPGGEAPGPLMLARRNDAGVWNTEPVPVEAFYASLTFDSAGEPHIAAVTPTGVTLIAKTLQSLLRGDFNLDDAVDSGDAPGFVQALAKESDYLTANPGLSPADLLPLGDVTADNAFLFDDARAFLDNLNTAALPGLPHRKAGFTAFDQADGDSNLGSGTGNFFATTLATSKPYEPGDARGDLVGATAAVADGAIGIADVNYLASELGLPAPDPRTNLNGDGTTDTGDFDELIRDVLGTEFGDLNLDRVIDLLDLVILAGNYETAPGVGSWHLGDITLDGLVNADDLELMAPNFGWTPGAPDPQSIGLAPDTLAALAGLAAAPQPTPEPGSLAVLTCAAMAMRLRGRASRSHRP